MRVKLLLSNISELVLFFNMKISILWWETGSTQRFSYLTLSCIGAPEVWFGLYEDWQFRLCLFILPPPEPLGSVSSFTVLPSNAHIATPFFQKTVFFSKIFLGKPPSKFLEVCLNSEHMWKWSPVYNFNSVRALKKLQYFPPVSKLPLLCQTPTHRRIY